MYEPNQIIENNIIIFKGKANTESSAPITLHLRNGSVIRNNIIIIEDAEGEISQSAISLIDSKEVVIENNRIYGTSKVWKDWDGASSVKESGTTFLQSKPMLLHREPGVH